MWHAVEERSIFPTSFERNGGEVFLYLDVKSVSSVKAFKRLH